MEKKRQETSDSLNQETGGSLHHCGHNQISWKQETHE